MLERLAEFAQPVDDLHVELGRLALRIHGLTLWIARATPGSARAAQLEVERLMLESRRDECLAAIRAAQERLTRYVHEEKVERFRREQPNRSARDWEEFLARLKEDLARSRTRTEQETQEAADVEQLLENRQQERRQQQGCRLRR